MKDTEESYGDYTLDVFQSAVDGWWVCDWWHRGDPLQHCGQTQARKRQEAIRLAQEEINAQEDATP